MATFSYCERARTLTDKQKMIPLGEAVPGCSYRRVWGWARRGLRDVNGNLQYLAIRKTPQGYATSLDLIEAFYRKLNGEE
jgi:hypothetical protein